MRIYKVENEPKRISLNWDFIGKGNKFDEVILSIHWKEENYDFGISIKNIFEDSHRNAFFDFKMEKPYQGDLLSIDLDYNIITGESRFVYDINIPEILIGEGNSLEEATKSVGMVVEGVKTAKSAYNLAIKYNVTMPITKEIYGVLYEGKDVKNSVVNLMLRDKKHEMEDIVSIEDMIW